MPPGGSRSPAEPTGAASRCAPVLVPGAAVLAAARLGISPAPHPRAGASAFSQFPGLARSAPALALRFSRPDTHTGSRRSPRMAESSLLTYRHQSLPQGIRELGLGPQDCKGSSGSRHSPAKARPSFGLASSALQTTK
ncbi:hypothetical protein NDU88_006423 [Pleurodeles waltl]|uniref:Uncharacterized protein n=1 Tax=Pleurodeles waltl TaxID=8319 RepID=A0AAV7NY21_PLEWA|nr:hypothetical protein NDU88_006423 [Pleurodeles waltl]